MFVDDDDQTAKAFALADNRTADLGTYDDQALADLLAEVAVDPELLLATGYSLDDLADLSESLDVGGTIDEPDEVPASAPAKTIKGDVWLLGPHRLVCGDSTQDTTWSSALAGKRAEICFTSPPYNVGKSSKLSGNKNASQAGTFYMHDSDDSTKESYANLLRDFTLSALQHCKLVAVNLQSLAQNKTVVLDYLHFFKAHLVDIVVWDKGHTAPAMANNVLNSRFEWIILLSPEKNATRAIPTASFRGTIDNVYLGPPQRNNEFATQHAATFPAHLPDWVIRSFDGSGKGSIVDCFMGTGTTLIAAHQAGRASYGIELDEHYCDIICARFQKATGIKPINEATGNEHDFLAE